MWRRTAASRRSSPPSSRRRPARRADLPGLVGAIQKPPFDTIGVLDLETFYPAKDRQDLALRFNSVLATPGFDVWLDGDPLDVGVDAVHARGQAARGHRLDRPPRRHRADARRVAAAQRAPRLDAEAGRHQLAARDALHGRGVRLSAAGGQPALEGAAAHAARSRRARLAWAWCSRRRTRWTSTTRRCRTPARGSSASCRPNATRRACSTASKA